jgi:hypothetical protein
MDQAFKSGPMADVIIEYQIPARVEAKYETWTN